MLYISIFDAKEEVSIDEINEEREERTGQSLEDECNY
jgi:hypothetical protein